MIKTVDSHTSNVHGRLIKAVDSCRAFFRPQQLISQYSPFLTPLSSLLVPRTALLTHFPPKKKARDAGLEESEELGYPEGALRSV